MKLQVENISKAFGERQVLDGLSFALEAGEVAAVLGGNGAGKTTLLRIVSGLTEPDSGRVVYDGGPLSQDIKNCIGYLPEERGLYPSMGVAEQAVFFARLKGLSRHEARSRVEEWFERLGMAEWGRRPAGRLSKGMQQRLQFVVAVAHRPSLLLLDEPFSGFDQVNADLLKREIRRLSESGTAVLLSTHNLAAAEELGTKTIRL